LPASNAREKLSGRVAVEGKPDALQDRPDLERLYARLEDELRTQGAWPHADRESLA
jgi:hypothetical protein